MIRLGLLRSIRFVSSAVNKFGASSMGFNRGKIVTRLSNKRLSVTCFNHASIPNQLCWERLAFQGSMTCRPIGWCSSRKIKFLIFM